MKPLTAAQERFIDNLLSRMTLEEMVGQLNSPNATGFAMTGARGAADNLEDKIRNGQIGVIALGSFDERRRMQEIAVNESRLGIPLAFTEDVIHGRRTIFPTTLASSWDMDLVRATARHAAAEARADNVHITWAPMGDVSEDQRWGRVAENPVESPYLTACYVRAMVEGFQGNDLSAPDALAATAKHVAGYAFGKRGGEYKEVDMGPQKFHRTCLPPFKAAAEAGVAGYMLGFHTLDGIPMTCHAELGEVITSHWGFKGDIATDYSAIWELENHGVAHDSKEAAYLAFKHGHVTLDLVSEAFVKYLPELVEEGRITKEEVADRCRRNLELKVRLFWDENTQGWDALRHLANARPMNYAESIAEASRALARHAVHESAVLLKNDGALPLAKEGTKIAVIGPLGGGEEARRSMQGTWAVKAKPEDSVTIFEGLQAMAGEGTEVRFAKGANITDDPNVAARLDVHNAGIPTASIDARSPDELLAEAADLAREADSIVLCIGEAKENSGESSSTSDAELAENQMKLLKTMRDIADETGKKLVVVAMSGRVIPMGRIEPLADAILFPGHPGTEAGNGIADILYGDANPSGKMTMSVLRASGQAPMTHEELPTGRPASGEGITVRGDREIVRNIGGRLVAETLANDAALGKALKEPSIRPAFRKFTTEADLLRPDSPEFPFGYGLSYTTFAYGKPEINKRELNGENDLLTVSVNVRNTGNVDGRETVMVFKNQPAGPGRLSVSHPKMELIDFRKVEIKAGEEATVSFDIPRSKLEWINARTVADYTQMFEPGPFNIMVGPNAGALETVRIEWQDERRPDAAPKPEIS